MVSVRFLCEALRSTNAARSVIVLSQHEVSDSASRKGSSFRLLETAYTVCMKLILARLVFVGLVGACVCSGCVKSTALKDAGDAEKTKEQGQIDSRSSQIDKMAGSAGGN